MEDDCIVMRDGIVGRKGVSLERLEALCRVGEAGSIMMAAKGDPNRQSLYSRQIKELEQALQMSLLDRSALPHRLSGEGERLERMTREYLDGVESLVTEASGREPMVRIGAGESTIQWLLLPLLVGERGSTPRVRFLNLTSKGAVDGIRARRIDLGVVPLEDAAGDLRVEKLGGYGMMVIGNAGRLPAKALSWDALAGRGLAVLEGRRHLRQRLDQLCGMGSGVMPVVLECTSYPQVIEACCTGGLFGVVPEIARPAARRVGLECWTFDELSEIRVEMALIWSPAVADAKPGVAEVVRRLAAGSLASGR